MIDDARIIIYGNGAMARVLFSFARRSMDICAFTVDDPCIPPGEVSFQGLPLVPFTDIENRYPPDDFRMITAVGFGEMNDLRERKYQEARAKGYTFVSYMHDSFMQHDGVVIEDNCIILDHVSIHVGCTVGRGTFISSNVNVGHDCRIGYGNWINSGVAIAGGCIIGSRCFFGVNASVVQNVTIGNQNFIAANTLISRNTQDGEVYISEAGVKFKLQSKAFLKFSPNLNS